MVKEWSEEEGKTIIEDVEAEIIECERRLRILQALKTLHAEGLLDDDGLSEVMMHFFIVREEMITGEEA